MPRRLTLAAGAGIALALTASSATARSYIKAAILIGDFIPKLRHLGPNETSDGARTAVSLRSGEADLYESNNRSAPGVVFVHGANTQANADARVVGLCRAIASRGRIVLAPALKLGRREIDPADKQVIADSIDFLHARTSEKVFVLAFSYGAALALTSLGERPEIQDKVAAVATIGTYFDLIHLVEGLTCGSVPGPGGGRVDWEPAAEAKTAVAEFLARYAGVDGKAISRALVSRDPSTLDEEQQRFYELIFNDDPAKVADLFAALPEAVRGLADSLSPSKTIQHIRVPLHALHSVDDPAAPFSESELLVEAVSANAQARLTKVELFKHVSFSGGAMELLKDAGGLLSFTAAIFRAQEKAALP